MSKCRLHLLSQIICAICSINTVNLKKVANTFGGKASTDSNYRKLQRFFASADFCYDELARYIVILFFNETTDWFLSLDRTNWCYGKSKINILVLSICYKGRAIPICWKMLDKAGNSDTQERIDLISRFINLFGSQRIKGLLADREFIGEDWFKWLEQNKIPYIIRLKNNSIATTSRGLPLEVHGLFYHIKVKQIESLNGKRSLWNNDVYLSGTRTEKGELLIVASNRNFPNAIEIYAKRWEIETLFECLKGRGFNFEDTRLTELDRVNRMVGVLALAYCWAHKTGEWRMAQGEGIKVKKHGRLTKSMFRHGLDLLQRLLINSHVNLRELNHCIKLMIPRDHPPLKLCLLVC